MPSGQSVVIEAQKWKPFAQRAEEQYVVMECTVGNPLTDDKSKTGLVRNNERTDEDSYSKKQ
jgi:hypothetical protein